MKGLTCNPGEKKTKRKTPEHITSELEADMQGLNSNYAQPR